MTDAARAQAFIEKWGRVTINEKATAQEHFVDLCRLLGVKTPNEADPQGQFFRFEKPLTKTGGQAGFADVWYRDRFAWEYKSKNRYPDLRAAYQQLLLYKEDLDNPPVLVACDISNYEIHIAFTGYRTRVERFTNAELANISTRELLRQVFTNPEQLRPIERTDTITETVAGRFAQVAQFLEKRGVTPAEIAPFFMKVLFALFAEDIRLLPAELMSQSLKQSVRNPEQFPERARALFRAMRDGGYFGLDRVPRFNGWLFDGDDVIALSADELQFLGEAARQDWAAVEPAIFGTLFERSLDPSKRSQLGAHYTSRDDILLIIEPVLMVPLRREWASHRTAIEALREQWETQTGNARRRLQSVAEGVVLEFAERLANVRILDPACGSGNFLYVALNQLKDLEKEVWQYAGGIGLAQPELAVSPRQLFGIEKNQFAAELAQVVVWIGYLQWLKTNGFLENQPQEPILQALHNIECRDAILAVDLHGNPVEPVWPAADVIVGNPPFLGGKRLRSELGDTYLDALYELYNDRIQREADLITYWFEKARQLLADDKVQRSGFIATNSIRGGANRRVLDRIKQTGNIFMAWSDRSWVLDGAAVRVSMIGFDAGLEQEQTLNGQLVNNINSDLTASYDLTTAKRLNENLGIAYMGSIKNGAFDISLSQAQEMLKETNASQRNNSDVIVSWNNGLDITRTSREMWIIDFGVGMPEAEARQYEKPFAYVEKYVKPERANNRNPRVRDYWWLHEAPRPEMRKALQGLQRYMVTPRVAKHRLMVFLDRRVNPDCQLIVFARDDNYFFGVLHSKVHELWSLRMCTWLGVGNDPRYTPTTTFETFPFPYPPGREDQRAPAVQAIAQAAQALVAQRDLWLAGGEPEALTPALSPREREPEGAEAAGVAGEPNVGSQHIAPRPRTGEGTGVREPGVREPNRTLTGLYNTRPDWLDLAHRRLDQAVFAAYDWPPDLADDAILERLLALNGQRAVVGGGEL